MISFGTLPCDQFAKDASEYPYKPSPAIAARIQHMENHISSKSPLLSSQKPVSTASQAEDVPADGCVGPVGGCVGREVCFRTRL